MPLHNLSSKIHSLIRQAREGGYWDFKEKHHDNNAELLHDILCLANSVNKEDKYLIYGVSDPHSGCEVKGVEGGNRRTQSDLIDFIRSKKFAGDNRPEIELRQISIGGKVVDVIVINERPEKPYYLNEDYRDGGTLIRAGYIYTRTLDTNTPINQFASYRKIEAMWRERFGLDLEPGERFVELLKDSSNWEKDLGSHDIAYHKKHPEYQIEFEPIESYQDVYSYFYINEKSFLATANFRYLSTKLFSLTYICCDETRVRLACPDNHCIRVGGREIWYMSYELDSRNGAFLNFLTNGSFDFRSRSSEAAFIVYKSKGQREEFESFVSTNIDLIDKENDDEGALLVEKIIEKNKRNFIFKPTEMMKLKVIFDRWNQTF
jgi:Putative DNA-binding domain